MTGGGGGSDNIFYVDGNDTAIAGAGDGIDTIISYWGSVTLPTGFSVGEINGPGTITANGGNDILVGLGAYAQTFVGGGGDDLMIGSATGQDRYIVDQANGGSAAIEAFKHGTDVLQLNDFSQFNGASLATITNAMTQVGANVVLSLGGGQTVTFVGQTIAQFTAKDFAIPLSTSGLTQTFDDEFNTLSASASGVGTTWQFMTGSLSANDEVETYQAFSGAGSPFSLSNGVLDITAKPVSSKANAAYTSGGLTTAQSFSQTYGLFEINAEMPTAAGMWPAFWLLSTTGAALPELDVAELIGNNPDDVYVSTHSDTGSTSVPVYVGNVSSSFHTYAVDWEPTTITYYFDGNAIASLPTPADMNSPMYMLLNLAVGGAGTWAGAADGETGQMLVSWVRAYASIYTPISLTLDGSGGTISRGDGAFTIAGSSSNGTITLGDGSQNIDLTGSGNTITVGAGNSVITAGTGHDTVTTGAGNSTIAVIGTNNVLNAGPGDNTISGGSGYDTFLLNPAGQGLDTLSHFTATGHDVLDFSRALAGLNVTLTTAGLEDFITAKTSSAGTAISIDTTGHGGAGQQVALLSGVNTSVGALLANGNIGYDGKAY